MRALAPFVVLAILAVGLLLTAPTGDAQTVFGTITGPTALAPRQASTYNVTVGGGPEAGIVTYSLEFFLTGSDLAGGTPRSDSPGSTSGNQTSFRIDITAPEKDQVVTLVVRISASGGGAVVNGTAETSIQIITPIVLRATFRNVGPTSALNVSVRFYVDGTLVGTRSLARINASAQETASLSYLPVGLAPGPHTVRVEADIDGDGRIDPARGELVLSDLFIRETGSLSAGWNVLIGIGVFFAAFLVIAGLRRRNR
ncbi:MAG: CARDB domain-containing protein [Methanobacteriota archaeon]